LVIAFIGIIALHPGKRKSALGRMWPALSVGDTCGARRLELRYDDSVGTA
jgi:hypothetical protein